MTNHSNDIAQTILDTISLISDKTTSSANFSSTIQGTVVECQDASTGKYLVKYQDSLLTAYSDPKNTYTKNTLVYILVSKNNLGDYKTILGSVNQLGTDYIDNFYESDFYDMGTNLIEEAEEKIIKLNSYKEEEKILYKYNNNKENLLSFNENNLNNQIKNANFLKITGKVQTKIPYQQRQSGGRYGIKINLLVKNAATGESEIQEYFFDTNNFIGNPYLYSNTTLQEVHCPIDSSNFIRIDSIVSFTQGFTQGSPQQENIENVDDNIFIYDFSINGSYQLTAAEKSGVVVLVSASRGYTFFNNDEKPKVFQAKMKANMKDVNLKNQGVQIYWFKQDIEITSFSKGFSRYGGVGWKCLNLYDEKTNLFKPSPTLSVKPSQVFSKQTQFKCVAYYAGKTYSREFVITNNAAQYQVKIECLDGDFPKTSFNYSEGHPELICKIFKKDAETAIIKEIIEIKKENSNENESYDDYVFKWQVCNYQNQTTYLKNSDFIEEYNYAKEKKNYIKSNQGKEFLLRNEIGEDLKNELQKKIKGTSSFSESTTYQTVYNFLKEKVKTYEKLQRVENNHIYNLNLHEIIVSSTFRCACYKKIKNKNKEQELVLIGTSSIQIKNSQAPARGYSLVINYGDQNFLYNEEGTSLYSEALDKPYEIHNLSYSFFENGKQIDDKNLRENANGTFAYWKVPIKNTLLNISVGEGVKQSNGYYLIKDTENKLSFDVANIYNSNLSNNDIYLILNYKGQEFITKTNFTFSKIGQNGTNGTSGQLKLKLKKKQGIDKQNKDILIDISPFTTIDFFKLQDDNFNNSSSLYREGDIIVVPQFWKNGVKQELKGNPLINFLNNNNIDVINNNNNNNNNNLPPQHLLEINTGKSLIYKKSTTLAEEDNIKKNICHILQCKYQDTNNNFNYYANLPLITAYNKSDYSVEYVQGSGFNYVTYRNDGTRPIYDNRTPFEVKVFKSYEGGKENITELSNADIKVLYEWSVLPENSSFLILPSKINSFKIKVTPNAILEKGNQIDNALLLKVTIKEKIEGKTKTTDIYLHIPVHFMINRYENKFLNNWNGTTIQLNKNDGYILAPQVGAGIKNNDNSFTGIVIGVENKVDKTNNKEKQRKGLFGYSKGRRSIFLDADTGNAEFGLPDKGQIKINVKDQAIIQSGDYPNAGMQIQFSNSPHIYFGSGNFKVEPNGYLYSKGGGNIAGWQIRDKRLFNGFVGMAPFNWNHYTDDDEEKKLESKNYTGVFWAGKPSNEKIITIGEKDFAERNFFVTGGGFLFSKSGQIAGWDISPSSLSKTTNFSSVGMSVGGNEDKNSSPVCFWAGDSLTERNFYVRRNGYLFSRSGNIGGWDISSDMLYKQQINTDNKYTAHVGMSTNHVFKWQEDNIPICFWAGTSPNQSGMNFYVKRDGYLFSKYGKIGNWFIGNGGLYHAPNEKRTTKTEYQSYLYRERIDYLKRRIEILNDVIKNTTDKTKKANYKRRKEINDTELKKLQNDIKTGKASYEDRVKVEKNINSNWKKEMDRTYGNTEDGLYIGADGIRLGSFFNVTELGGLYVTGGKIGGIEICQQGLRSSNWRVTGDGTAYFSQAIINDTDVVDSIVRASKVSGSVGSGGFSGGGVSLGSSGSGASGTTIDPGVHTPDGETWDTYIDKKIKGLMNKNNILKVLTGVGIEAKNPGTALSLSGITINAKDLYVTDHIDGNTLYITKSISIGKDSVATTADLSDYAKSSDLSALAKRVSDLENSKPTT